MPLLQTDPLSLLVRALLPVSGHALFGVIMGFFFGKAKFSDKPGYLRNPFSGRSLHTASSIISSWLFHPLGFG